MSEILKNTIWGESRVDGKYDYLINPKTIFNFLSIAEKTSCTGISKTVFVGNK